MEIGKSLLSSLNDAKKQKWIDTIESLDIKKSSRKARKLLHRLEGKFSPNLATLVKPQAISSVLKGNSKIKIDKSYEKRIKIDMQ